MTSTTSGIRSRSRAARRAAVALAAGLTLLAAACGRDATRNPITPTGIRPPLLEGTGVLSGYVIYDPVNFPDLATPPYPPTIVTLLEGATTVAVDTLADTTRFFAFHDLLPGAYTVRADARLLTTGTAGPTEIYEDARDAGDVRLNADPSEGAVDLWLVGSFDGESFADSCKFLQSALGRWLGPDFDADSALTLAAGTYAIRFFALGNDVLEYGIPAASTVDVPVTGLRLEVLGTSANGLRLRFPQTGRYRFFLDERRQTLGVESL
jgi:hypothetical protein